MILAAASLWLASLAAGDAAGWKPSRAPTDQDRRIGAIADEAAAHSAQVTRWEDVPPAVRDAFRAHSGISGMSDAGGPFNPTDVGGRDSPRIRLRYAIAAQGYWFVCYETGGEAHQQHVAIWAGNPPLWARMTLYRANPSTRDIGPDLAAHFYFDEP